MSNRTLSRRDFLKIVGAGTTGTVAAGLAANIYPVSASGAASADAWGMLIDLTRCIGCNSCSLACKEANRLPKPQGVPDKLDSDAYTFVALREVPAANGKLDAVYVKRQCMHCQHPGCASACTVGALRKTAEGPVVYDSWKCIGCRYCQYACPFGVPTYEWENPLGLIHKCTFCAARLSRGDQPACVKACPAGVLHFGKREDMLAQAHATIASNPGRYIDQVYGEHEVGGTSMLYLSAVPYAELGFPELGPEVNPRYAEAVMTKTPFIALTVASVATGLNWFFGRREQNHSAAHGHVDTTGEAK